jgi:hypothetical protein
MHNDTLNDAINQFTPQKLVDILRYVKAAAANNTAQELADILRYFGDSLADNNTTQQHTNELRSLRELAANNPDYYNAPFSPPKHIDDYMFGPIKSKELDDLLRNDDYLTLSVNDDTEELPVVKVPDYQSIYPDINERIVRLRVSLTRVLLANHILTEEEDWSSREISSLKTRIEELEEKLKISEDDAIDCKGKNMKLIDHIYSMNFQGYFSHLPIKRAS